MKTLLSICLLVLISCAQYAHAQGYVANLDGAQAGGGARTGIGQVYLYLTGTTLSFSNGTYSGLSGTVSSAHIHGPGAPGVSAGVIFDLVPTFITTGATSGNIAAGNTALSAGNALDLQNGLLYINIHTSTFGGGEIRGQVLLMPEPSTVAMLIVSVAFVQLKRRACR